jgi:hypothetical protein
MRHYILRSLLLLWLLLALLAGCAGAPRERVYTIPPGTAARLAAGEQVSVLPSLIELALDREKTLVIQNNDTAAVQIGPYRIEPGQRFVQRYDSPGTFDLFCSVHAGKQLRIVVKRSATG